MQLISIALLARQMASNGFLLSALRTTWVTIMTGKRFYYIFCSSDISILVFYYFYSCWKYIIDNLVLYLVVDEVGVAMVVPLCTVTRTGGVDCSHFRSPTPLTVHMSPTFNKLLILTFRSIETFLKYEY